VKQAIYGWRGGCAEIFEQVINDLSLPDQSLGTLRTSYRTSPVVLEVVNEVFEGIADLPPVAELQPYVAAWARGFQEHRAQYADRPGYVELVASPMPARGQDPGAAYLDFVADQVAELARRYRGHNLGVLVRTNRTADRVLQCLRQRGVAASGEGGAALTSDAAVELILSALRLADHPGHTAAAFHVLHSPLAELLGLELLEAGHVAKVARSIRRSLIDEGYAATLTRWARHLADRCNARSVGRLTQLIELAQQYDPALTLRADDFVRFVESAQVEDPTPAPVRVMTVHRAKGLEFDAVVLAELSDLIGQTARLMLWQYRPHPTAPSQAVFRSVSQEMRAVLEAYDPIVARAHEQEVGRRVADDLSALYVAMTRPRYALHMIVEPLRLTKSGWGRPGLSNASPAAILRHALTDVSDPLPEGVLYRLGDPDWSRRVEAPAQAEVEPAAVPLVRLIKDEQASRSWATVTPSSLEGGGVIDAADLLELEVSASRRRGTLWHAWLAQVGFVDEPQGVPEDQVLMDVGRPLWPEAELAEQIERFRAALARPKVQQVLRRNGAAELWRERPFAVHERGKLIQGIFDRAVLWRENGQTESVLLIDFKTDAVEQSEFLDAAVERYRPQLDAYRRALGRMLRLKESSIRACLVFLMAGAVVEV
ncbi:MAG TPA: 3'-5' exonuclease, partial [Phycisphaeraceae bacterium]